MLFAPAPPGSTLPDSAERKPSGILSALVFDQGASVSSSFPFSAESRWGPAPPAQVAKQHSAPPLWGVSGKRQEP